MIKSCELGHPVMLGEAVGRIVGYSEEGMWGEINGQRVFSILHFGTPHGSVVSSGIMHLTEASPEALEKLDEYENDLRYNLETLYRGVLDDILPKDTETYVAKLRNSLTPLYSLSQMVLLLENDDNKKREELLNLIISSAK